MNYSNDIKLNLLDLLETARRIKESREAIGLTLQQASKRASISKSALQRYENGDIGKMPLWKLRDLAEALEVPVGYLFGVESKDLRYEYYENINGLLEEKGFKLKYKSTLDLYLLISDSEFYQITAAELKSLKKETSSYLSFKLEELKKNKSPQKN